MRRSVPAKLFVGFLIISMGIVLLISWFAIYLTAESLASRERTALTSVGSTARAAEQAAELLALNPSAESYRELAGSSRRLHEAIDGLPALPRMLFHRQSLDKRYSELREWSLANLSPLPEAWDPGSQPLKERLGPFLTAMHRLGQLLDGYAMEADAFRNWIFLLFALLIAVVGAGLVLILCAYGFFIFPDLSRDFQVLMSFSRGILAGTVQGEPSLSREREDEIGELFEQLLRNHQLKRSLDQVRSVVFELSNRLKEVEALAGQAYGSVSKQAELLENSGVGFSDISAAIRAAAENARFHRQGAEDSSSEARTVSQGMEEAGVQMRELSEKIDRVEEITTFIQDIADQTDLLALNAAIEAARAGEFGQGFKVVALEVQKLADRSGNAATEAGELVQSIQEAMNLLARRYGEVQTVMGSILRDIGRIADSTGQVVSNTDKAAGAISRTSQALESVTNLTIEGLNNASGALKAYQDLRASSDRLQGLIAGLQEYWKPIAYKGLQVSLQEAKPLDAPRPAAGA
jgi:methyl-accepting chemotaxis protein